MPGDFEFNDEQAAAVAAMTDFIRSDVCLMKDDRFFVLSGSAGTGKTSTVEGLVSSIPGRLVFTAPTNKAAKVLRQRLTTPDYTPDCRTIYSLLGLKLETSGEVKELSTPEEEIDLTRFRAVIVDEASMLNSQVMRYIAEASETYGVKFIFLGDKAQLPPVGEAVSPIWKLQCPKADLSRVMRHDNQILTLATSLRGMVDHPAPRFRPVTMHSDDSSEGIWAVTNLSMRAMIRDAADAGEFSKPEGAKVIAWRNVTVDVYNGLIRSRIFPETTEQWLPGDRVLFMQPANDLEDEPMAKTDDEGEITRVTVSYHPIYSDYKVFNVHITLDDNRPVIARVLHPDTAVAWERRRSNHAAEAQINKRLWKDYWLFVDSFHKIRYAYAITAHRSQGSTYDDAYVDYRDILMNYTRREAMRCLYVACTRPRKRLILG